VPSNKRIDTDDKQRRRACCLRAGHTHAVSPQFSKNNEPLYYINYQEIELSRDWSCTMKKTYKGSCHCGKVRF
jgi:hypothetical protein